MGDFEGDLGSPALDLNDVFSILNAAEEGEDNDDLLGADRVSNSSNETKKDEKRSTRNKGAENKMPDKTPTTTSVHVKQELINENCRESRFKSILT